MPLLLHPLAIRLIKRILKIFPGLIEALADVLLGPFILAVSHAHVSF